MNYDQSNSPASHDSNALRYIAVILMVFSPIMLALSGAMPAILWITLPLSGWAWWYGCTQ
jgi:hypothetical protein